MKKNRVLPCLLLGGTLLEQLEGISFHRSLLNPLRSWFPASSTGREMALEQESVSFE